MRSLVVWVVLLMIGAMVSPQQVAGDTDFEAAVQAIDRQAKAGESTAEKLEEEYLSLLDQALSPSQEGLVYARIAHVYWRIRDTDAATAYCEEALSHPLPPEVAGGTYSAYANALWLRYFDWRGRRFAVARRRIIRPILSGLRVVLDAGAPRIRPPLTGVGTWSVPEMTPEMKRERARQVAERERVERVNELFHLRSRFENLCMDLYGRMSPDPEEFRDLASEALADHPEATKELLDRLGKKIKPKATGN